MERKGIYKSNKFPQRMREVFNGENGLLADKALCLGAAGDGTIFIGTENGVNYKKENGEKELVHTLNNTVIAPPRMLIAFLENNLQEDGSVLIPKALQPYMGGKERLIPNNK